MSECPYCTPDVDRREWVPDSVDIETFYIDLPGEYAPNEDECPAPRLMVEWTAGGWSYVPVGYCPMCGRDLKNH